MTKLNRTKIARKGPREIKANFLDIEDREYIVKEEVDGEIKEVVKTKPFTKLVIGFSGYKGYRYHPTRGWKKEAGFTPANVN